MAALTFSPLSDAVRRHQQLPIEIVQPQVAGMSQNQTTDSGRRQLHGDGAADAADPRDENGRGLQAALPLFAKAADPELPLVAAPFIGGEFGKRQHRRLTSGNGWEQCHNVAGVDEHGTSIARRDGPVVQGH